MKWYVADKDFVNYLNSIDGKVEEIEYGDSLKPYLGIVMNIGCYNYYLPVSSPKPWKHNRMKNGKDFLKVCDPVTNELIAVLNINNMIPIPPQYVTELEYDEVDKYRKFDSDLEKRKYIDLLRKELKIIKSLSEKIKRNAVYLYEHYKKFPSDTLSSRCCNFIKLEESSIHYKKD